MSESTLVQMLNQALQQEYACYIRYKTHAAILTGPLGLFVASKLDEIAEDEETHASHLRERIVALGGVPWMGVAQEDLRAASGLQQALAVNIDEEKKAIAMYKGLLKSVNKVDSLLLWEAIEHILEDEQEHLEELEQLQG